MDVDNTFIKPMLLFYFGKGKSEVEAHEEISKKYGQYAITQKTINKWFKTFRKEENVKVIKKEDSSKEKLTDNFIVDLVNENPELNLVELGKLVNTSASAISKRLRKINNKGHKVNYIKKDTSKFSDETLIDLINNYPELNIGELGDVLGASESAVAARIKQINSNGEKVFYKSKRNKGRKSESNEQSESKVSFTDEFLIELINSNPELNIKELAQICGTSKTTISKRIRKLSSDGEDVNYRKKDYKKGFEKFTNEQLIELISENPEFNMAQLAKITNSTKTTISKRIKQINNSECEGVKYINKGRQKEKSEVSEKPKFTDEFLINLVNENPSLNIKELAKLAGTSIPFISKRLKKIDWINERHKLQ